MIVANLPDDLEMFLSHHNLSVSAAAVSPCPLQSAHALFGAPCRSSRPRSELMCPVDATS